MSAPHSKLPFLCCRLEITTCNADGIESELSRLLEEECCSLLEADTISDGDFVFLSLKVSAPEHFTPETWCSLRDKLLRMVRLSSAVGLGPSCGNSQVRLLRRVHCIVLDVDILYHPPCVS